MKTNNTQRIDKLGTLINSIILLFIFIFISSTIYAQSPQKMTYQSVVRDASDNLLTNTTVGIQISILQGTPTGANVYSETFTPKPQTNINGLVTVPIGDGIPSGALFSSIDWSNGPYFLRVRIDPLGGTNYTITGTSQLLSVPYALYAETSGNANTSVGWSLSGNTGIDPTNNFIGTTDDQPLKFKIFNVPFGELNESTRSVFFGEQAGLNNAGIDNIGIGNQALMDNTAGFNNIGLGSNVLLNNTGAYNIGIGSFSLRDNTTGNRNIGMGHLALRDNLTGSDNIGLGNNTLQNNTIGNDNIGMGNQALTANTAGFNNIGMGNSALSSNTNGSGNIGIGNQALESNTIGSDNIGMGNQALTANTTGIDNIGMGDRVLAASTTGSSNIGIGNQVLTDNTTGDDNIGMGNQVLVANTTGNDNIGVGDQVLTANTTGEENIGIGNLTLTANTTGHDNIGMGDRALTTNTTGINNIAMGGATLFSNTTGANNIGIGIEALQNNTTGNNNVGIGDQALFLNTTGSNNIGIGEGAQVPNPAASNQIRMGNAAITLAQIEVGWNITSDKKWKEQIRPLPYGLDFVSQLKPMDYIRKNNEAKTREIGFIAQDLEKLLTKTGYTDQGFLTKDSNGNLSLRYNDLIPLLTKAIQELNDNNKALQKMNIELVKRIENLEQKH